MKFNKFYKLVFFGLSSFSILTPITLSSCRNNVVDSSNDDNKDDNTQQEIKKVKPPIQPANYDSDDPNSLWFRSYPSEQNITFKIDPQSFENELNKYCDWRKLEADFSSTNPDKSDYDWYSTKNWKLPNKDTFYNLLRANHNKYTFEYKDIVNGAEETITINDIDYFDWSCLFNNSCDVKMTFNGVYRKQSEEYLKNYLRWISISIQPKKGYEWNILRDDKNGTFNNSKIYVFDIRFNTIAIPKPQQ